MVKYSDPELDGIFNALADPSRRYLILSLKNGEASVEELGKPLGISTPAVMKHLSVLERSGLISTRKVGRRRLSRLKPDRLQQAESWINEARMFWEDVLTQLAAHVEGTEND